MGDLWLVLSVGEVNLRKALGWEGALTARLKFDSSGVDEFET